MDTVKTLVLATLLSSLLGMVIVQSCGKDGNDKRTDAPSKPDPKPDTPDVPAVPDVPTDISVIDYLATQKMSIGTAWKRVHTRVIIDELYTLEEMPFSSGKLKAGTGDKKCSVFPVAYWEKRDEDARCVVTIHFDCNGNERHHTSECIVL